MKILHFIIGKANPNRANGVNHVIHGLCKYGSIAGNDMVVVGLSKNMNKSFELVNREEFQVRAFRNFFKGCLPEIKKELKSVDIVHLHSVWKPYNSIIAYYCKKYSVPYIITTHSGLTDDRIKQSKYILKKMYHICFQERLFNDAAGVHAITNEEIFDVSKLTKNKNIFFVPNGIDTSKNLYSSKTYDFAKDRCFKFGYLGRFAIEKNIEGLILGIAKLPENLKHKIECSLIGPIDNDAKKLKSLVRKLKLENQIKFTGPIYGSEKFQKLRDLDFYIHTAFSDVVSIAAMEAMSCGLPLAITRTSQVSYYYDSNAFMMMEPTINEISNTIIDMIDNKNKWEEMSKNSVNLVEELFNWQSISNKMITNYKDILNKR
tara:strand:- start:1973 stop:3097 length:1125 start_codon:yes stop_codon:yes gene_type:complete